MDWEKIWAKWESSLTAVWLKWDPPVFGAEVFLVIADFLL